MRYLKISTIFIFLFCQFIVGQNKIYTKQEIETQLAKAGRSFLNLECKKSLDGAKFALEQSLLLNDYDLIAKSYNLIGLNIEEFSDYETAIDYYNRGLENAIKSKNDTTIGWLYSNMGNVYMYRLKKPKENLKYYIKGLHYAEIIKDESEIVYSKLSLAGCYSDLKDFKKCKKLLDDVANYVQNEGDNEANISLNSLYGLYYDYYNDTPNTEKYFLKALKFANENTIELINSNAIDVYDQLAYFYFKVKDYEKGYSFIRMRDSMQEKVYTAERKNEVRLASVNIENDEIRRKIEKIEAEKLIQDNKLRDSRIIVILFGVIFFILLLFLLSLYQNNKVKSKINKELKEINEELQVAKERAEEASKIKSQFISTISHELRTPLYGVIGTTDIIEEEYKELSNSSHLKALKFSANYLLSLVNDILSVYKFDEQKVVLEKSLFCLEDTINDIRDSLEIIAKRKKNKILISIDSSIPQFIEGDKIRFSQILINLISNSLKFTHNGYVKIEAFLESKINDDLLIKFEVQDTGIGIAKENQDKVFEKFVQIERREDDYQGTGLGLTIVKKIVDLFKGEVYLESEEGIGTKITFILPFKSGQKAIEKFINEVEVDFSESKRYKILVVEDNKINQMVTKRLLENHKFDCTIVDNGFEAIDLVKIEDFDAILMDINMPKINGFDTSRIIRENGFKKPIIAVTAFEKEEIKLRLEDAQINNIIVKPFDPNALFKMIHKEISKI